MTDQEEQTGTESIIQEVDGIPYVVIDDVLSDEEMAEAWKTVDALEISALSRDPQQRACSYQDLDQTTLS